MKVLVTGGAGFIGTNYVYFHKEKYPEDDIFVLDKLTYAGNKNNLEKLLVNDEITFIKGDIADAKYIADLFEAHKFDLVINFAAETHVDNSILQPDIFIQTNIIGTHNLLRASLDSGVKRFHQVSTDEVYGDLGEGSTNFFTESTPLDPNPPYAASKAAADLLVRSYFVTYGLPVTISRCSNNYGPYQYPEKLIPYFFRLATQDTPLPVYGDGMQIRDWLYVKDHCVAIDAIIKKGRLGDVYNVGGYNERTNLQITESILNFLGKSKNLITFVEDRKAHDRRYAIDPTKLETEFGWKPTVMFEDGIRMTFEWYNENQAWWKDLLAKANRTQ